MTESPCAGESLIVRCPDPLNAEPTPDRLVASFITPQRDFYIRSHGPTPRLAEDHRFEIGGLVAASRSYSVAELRDAFSPRTVIATIQCAGNRRAHLQGVKPTSGDPWDVGAIGNASWTGVALADVLNAVGVSKAARFVAFTGADEVAVDGDKAPFGVSIPLAKALAGDAVLAWAMNGEPLLPEHGAPLRLVVPGYAGVRSAKWLTRIEVRDSPSDAPIQAKDYKLFPATVSKDEADWPNGATIDEMPLNAAICVPADGAELCAGMQTIVGYAIAYGREVARVEVSLNGGIDWLQAAISRQSDARWSWVQWTLAAELPTGRHVLVVRTADTAGQVQTEHPETIWNFAGYLSTAWHRIQVTAA